MHIFPPRVPCSSQKRLVSLAFKKSKMFHQQLSSLSSPIDNPISISHRCVNPVELVLQDVQTGKISIDNAQERLRSLHYQKLSSYACLDHERSWRTNLPEVIFAEGKTALQVHGILQAMASKVAGNGRNASAMATRVSVDMFSELKELALKDGIKVQEGNNQSNSLSKKVDYNSQLVLQYYPTSRICAILPKCNEELLHSESECSAMKKNRNADSKGNVAVVCAGTSDISVAEEAAITCELFGYNVTRLSDVGIAGIHRLLNNINTIENADVTICCAGMDGALPGVCFI